MKNAAKKPSVLEYVTLGTLAYSVVLALIPALRAKKINRTKVYSQLLILTEQINSTFKTKIAMETVEKCMDASLAVLKDVR